MEKGVRGLLPGRGWSMEKSSRCGFAMMLEGTGTRHALVAT